MDRDDDAFPKFLDGGPKKMLIGGELGCGFAVRQDVRDR